MSDRIIGIPDDLEIVEGAVYPMSGDLPPLWHHLYYDLKAVHAKFREVGVEPGEDEVIAVNDTGKTNHDLLPEPVAERSFIRGESVMAGNLHGPHCAGIALGRDGLGVAPGAKLIVAKVLSNGGSGSTVGINAGRVWAAQQGATIISESLGDNGGPDITEDIQAYDEAYEAGVSLCTAALGNSGPRGIGRPGSYDRSYGIANHRENGSIAPSSSIGPAADLTGPGTNIISCDLNNRLATLTGTSMACPFIAGVVALFRHWMRITGRPVPQGHAEWRAWFKRPENSNDVGGPGHDPVFGDGIPRIANALKVMKNSTWACIFLMFSLFISSNAYAQNPLMIDTSSVEIQTVVQTIAKTTVVYGDVELPSDADKITDETITTTNAISIKSTEPIKKVSAFSTDFDLGEIVKVSDNEVLLRGKPGRYLITVYTEGDFEQSVVELEGSTIEPPPIDDSEFRTNLLDKLPNDPTIAGNLANAYETTINTHTGDLSSLRKAIGLARVKVLGQPRDESKDWNSFIFVIDAWAVSNVPDLETYKAAMGVVIEVLRSSVDPGSLQSSKTDIPLSQPIDYLNTPLTLPVSVWTEPVRNSRILPNRRFLEVRN